VVGSPMRSIALRACGGPCRWRVSWPPASWNEIGYFDDETCRLEPIENPFGPTVLPMSPEYSFTHVTGTDQGQWLGTGCAAAFLAQYPLSGFGIFSRLQAFDKATSETPYRAAPVILGSPHKPADRPSGRYA